MPYLDCFFFRLNSFLYSSLFYFPLLNIHNPFSPIVFVLFLLMGGMNVLMVRNYYAANIPYAIIEAARIDGANDLKIYTGIMVPLSKPVMTTIGLFAALGYWNNWTNGLYYISDSKLYSVQVYLMKLMNDIAYLKSSSYGMESAQLATMSFPTEGARMAIAMIAILPILMVYPFIQKELVKGMVVGGVKG